MSKKKYHWQRNTQSDRDAENVSQRYFWWPFKKKKVRFKGRAGAMSPQEIKRVIEEIGTLDEQYFAYYEDMDFCRRAIKVKWPTFFLHNAEIVHVLSTSWRQMTEKQLLISLKSEKRYLEKYYGYTGVLLLKMFYLYGSTVRFFTHLLSCNRAKAKHHYRILQWIIKNEI